MKFNEKLQKLRKENNLSQEQLADKLNVSRQAVSKWESGSSYPDMEKLKSITKVLNCKLEDILDDGIIGETKDKNKDYFKEFLKYITDSYNMFIAMTLKEKFKCLFEMFVVFIILLIFIAVSNGMFSYIIRQIFYIFDISILYRLSTVLITLFNILTLGLSVIIFLHIFKIRYLNYYVTIEDSTIKEKIIQKDIKEVKKENIKERLIIRDPKHSEYNFMNGLSKVVIILLKLMIVFTVIIPLLFAIVGLIACSIVSLFYISVHHLFIYIFMILLFGSVICLILLLTVIKAIFKEKVNIKLAIISFIITVILASISLGLLVSSILNINYYEKDLNYKKYSKEYELNDLISRYIYNNYNNYCYYELCADIVLEDRDNVLIELESSNKVDMPSKFEYPVFSRNYNFYNTFIDDLKDNKICTNYHEFYGYKNIKIYISQDNLDNIIKYM